MSKRSTTKEFIEKSVKIHNNKYDYSLVSYVNAHVKVKIICSIHGIFELVPNKHLSRKCGCPKCGRLRTKNRVLVKEKTKPFKIKKIYDIENYKKKCNIKHNFKYDYSKVEYVNSITKIIIICKEHGEFYQKPSNHLKGRGCSKCAILKISKLHTSNINTFIKKANKIHNNKYDYSLVDYNKSWIKVKILCKLHGFFEQTPSHHLFGNNCPKCGFKEISNKASKNPTGWSLKVWTNASKRSKHFDSFKVYIIKCFNEDEEFYKIGRTFLKVKQRYKSKINMPYKWEIIEEIIGEPEKIYKLEKELQKENKEFKYIPKINFNGKHECFYKLKNYEEFFIK